MELATEKEASGRHLLHHMMTAASATLESRLVVTDAVKHRGLRGSLRETMFRAVLADYLPRAFEVTSGEVHAVGREPSRQQDCLVVDGPTTVPLLRLGSEGIYPIECVRASVELKSRYTAAELRKAVRNVASVKALAPSDHAWSPHGSVVCYPSKTTLRAVAETFLDECMKLPERERADTLLVVGAGVAFWGEVNREGALMPLRPEESSRLHLVCSAEDGLLLYLLGLVDALEAQQPPQLNLFRYASAGLGQLKVSVLTTPKEVRHET